MGVCVCVCVSCCLLLAHPLNGGHVTNVANSGVVCVCAVLDLVKLREKQTRLLSIIEGLEAARQERNEEIAALKVRAVLLQTAVLQQSQHWPAPALCPPCLFLPLPSPSLTPSPSVEGE